ncbi:MAG: AAA-like domain-containing protein [Chthoniobacteraceae bacterium]
MSDFYNQGAVPLASLAYIPRKFETQVFQEVTTGKWVLLLGPRQHGKSSGLVRLATKFREAGLLTALVDLQGLPPCASFPELLSCFTDQIGRSVATVIPRPKEEDRGNVVSWLNAAFPAGGPPVVVIIDEAASIENTDFRNAFYGQIRQISSERAYAPAGAIAARIRFVFAGTFRPETLVQERNSPFNVCQSVETDDVTVEQAKVLADVVHPEFGAFVAQAHAALNGQPFLLQTVFHETLRCTETPLELAFKETLDNMQQVASGHLEGIFSKVIGNAGLTLKVAMMVRDGHTDLIPADSDCAFLQVLGLAKRQGARLVFRNSLYSKVARASPQIVAPTGQQAVHTAVFGIQKTDLGVMKNSDLFAICFSAYDGAAKAHSNGSFRLALTGFGSAMESLLLDLLMRLTAADLQTAIVATAGERDHSKKTNFQGHEINTNPKTWRLVNMINVARKVKVGVNALEPSHALREWRNLVHPAVAMQQFSDESKLAPESVAASALFAILLRDITP